MNVVLDTCVVSEVYRPDGEAKVKTAVWDLGKQAYVSVITIGEILRGAELLAPSRRQNELLVWLDALQNDLGPRILPVDLEVARLWGQLTARAQRQGRQIAAPDGLIAATARIHRMPVMTRNVHDFIPAGVQVVNPWPN